MSATLSSAVIFSCSFSYFVADRDWPHIESIGLPHVSRLTVISYAFQTGLLVTLPISAGLVPVGSALSKSAHVVRTLVAISICKAIDVFHSPCSRPFSGAAGAAARRPRQEGASRAIGSIVMYIRLSTKKKTRQARVGLPKAGAVKRQWRSDAFTRPVLG